MQQWGIRLIPDEDRLHDQGGDEDTLSSWVFV